MIQDTIDKMDTFIGVLDLSLDTFDCECNDEEKCESCVAHRVLSDIQYLLAVLKVELTCTLSEEEKIRYAIWKRENKKEK